MPLDAEGRPDWSRFTLRPFIDSRTHANLLRTRCGVFHIIDDALLLARAVCRCDAAFPTTPAREIAGDVLTGCCRYFEFVVDEYEPAAQRPRFAARTVAAGSFREHRGFNRAAHAVVEAAILYSRRHLFGPEILEEHFDRLRPLVEKTGRPRRRRGVRADRVPRRRQSESAMSAGRCEIATGARLHFRTFLPRKAGPAAAASA